MDSSGLNSRDSPGSHPRAAVDGELAVSPLLAARVDSMLTTSYATIAHSSFHDEPEPMQDGSPDSRLSILSYRSCNSSPVPNNTRCKPTNHPNVHSHAESDDETMETGTEKSCNHTVYESLESSRSLLIPETPQNQWRRCADDRECEEMYSFTTASDDSNNSPNVSMVVSINKSDTINLNDSSTISLCMGLFSSRPNSPSKEESIGDAGDVGEKSLNAQMLIANIRSSALTSQKNRENNSCRRQIVIDEDSDDDDWINECRGNQTKRKFNGDGEMSKPKRKKLRKIRFHRQVDVRWTDRIFAVSNRKEYVMTSEPMFDSVAVLKRPAQKKTVARISEGQKAAIAELEDFDKVLTLESNGEGCQDTCPEVCTPECSCRANLIECSPYAGCQCNDEECTNYDYSTHADRPGQVVDANKKTSNWTEKMDSTISSVGTIVGQVAEKEIYSDDMEFYDDETTLLDSSDSGAVASEDSKEDEPEALVNDSAPFAVQQPTSEEVPSFMYDDSATDDHSDDDVVHNAIPKLGVSAAQMNVVSPIVEPVINLEAENFSTYILNLLPGMVDQWEENTCDAPNWLGEGAIFTGLLRCATEFNVANHGEGKRVAVLHPSAFTRAFDLAKEDAEREVRRKQAGVRGRAPEAQLDTVFVADRMVYGAGWTHILVPMFVNGNHWTITVVRRSTVEAVIYDSLPYNLAPRGKKAEREAIKLLWKEGIRKILKAVEALDGMDTTTSRFKIRHCQPAFQDLQKDGYSCGLFVIANARRALERKNGSLKTKTGEDEYDILQERAIVKQEIKAVRNKLDQLTQAGVPLQHGQRGQHPIHAKKVPLTVCWTGRA